jgi:hypothetical protein
METKFEYQVSAELAEKIAIEQYSLVLRLRGIKLVYIPILMGIVFSLLGSSAVGTIKIGGADYTLTTRMIGAALGFAFGLGIGLLIKTSLRRKIRAAVRAAYDRMGSTRLVFWDSESIHFKSTAMESKIGWRMIDRIEVGEVGVYGILGKRALFAIPRISLPSRATTDDLIKTWQNSTRQPPVIPS